MPRAEGEGRRVVLLGGEPGSGKSRLVREFAARGGRATGALVLYGACDAVVRTPYGPFVEALDHLARDDRSRRAAAALGTARRRADAAAARPARRGSASCRRRSTADPDTERHRLHTAVADLLAGVSRGGRCCSCSRTGTGRTRRRCCSCATWRAPAGERADAGARHLPRHRGRRPGHARGDARRPAPLRRRRPAAARRALRRGGRASSSAAPRAATLGAGPPELAQRDPRAHRGQRVPRLRAVARRWSRPASSRSSAARSG